MTDVLAPVPSPAQAPQPVAVPARKIVHAVAPAAERVQPVSPVAAVSEGAPSNELAVATWLDDEPQWVHDERKQESALAIGRRTVHVGDPRETEPVALTVAGTVFAAGLDVSADPNGVDGPVRLRDIPHISRAPDPARLRVLLVDPKTGQLYWDE